MKLEEKIEPANNTYIRKLNTRAILSSSKSSIFQDLSTTSETSDLPRREELEKLSKDYDEFVIADQLFFITSNLRYSENAEFEEVIDKLFDVATNMKDETARKRALSSLSLNLDYIPLKKFYSLWSISLHLFALHTRKELLANLEALIPLIHKNGGEESLLETSKAIEDVTRWWA